MAEQRDTRTRIWWLSGTLAILGVAIALCAAMEFFTATLIVVGLAVVVTIRLGMVLSQADQHARKTDKS
ncbi:hypothetical protein [Yaniella halotolerans]|uniref:hypothetical protein n=1 Tax=Yaniella halotolerans TaxID=225453 RepID=UPI0003B7502F|nr:hypothetical protein [Yaniella halotolerans]